MNAELLNASQLLLFLVKSGDLTIAKIPCMLILVSRQLLNLGGMDIMDLSEEVALI